jgi:hypothetical protein
MRFLIGIFTGTVLTLLVATAMDAPTHPILNNARDLAATGWDELINATSSSLFEQAGEPTAADATTPRAPADELELPADEPVLPADEAAAALDDLPVALPEPMSEQPSAFAPTPALPAPEPVAESPSSEFWVESALAAARQAHASQPVWVPFHSQMSAEGFATRLSQAIDHDFRVVRQGAGAYQVVFDATDADEQALIMAQVTEITGQ